MAIDGLSPNLIAEVFFYCSPPVFTAASFIRRVLTSFFIEFFFQSSCWTYLVLPSLSSFYLVVYLVFLPSFCFQSPCWKLFLPSFASFMVRCDIRCVLPSFTEFFSLQFFHSPRFDSILPSVQFYGEIFIFVEHYLVLPSFTSFQIRFLLIAYYRVLNSLRCM